MIIRQSEPRDFAQIAHLIVTIFERDFKAMLHTPQKVAASFANGIKAEHFYVAEVDGQIVGITACTSKYERAIYPAFKDCIKNLGPIIGPLARLAYKLEFENILPIPENSGYIEFVAVHPDYRRRGIATKIMHFVVDNNRFNEFRLDVYDNNIAAQICYKLFGYVEVDRQSDPLAWLRGFKYKLIYLYKK